MRPDTPKRFGGAIRGLEKLPRESLPKTPRPHGNGKPIADQVRAALRELCRVAPQHIEALPPAVRAPVERLQKLMGR